MEVLIAGAGPSGSRLAQLLAFKGINVSLVEPLSDPTKHAFSSAAIPIDCIKKHSIPIASIATKWSGWRIFTPESRMHEWDSTHPLGAVLDFGLLRRELWKDASQAGVNILLGWSVTETYNFNDYVLAKINGPKSQQVIKRFDFIIDATGYKRVLIGQPKYKSNRKSDILLRGSGVERIVQCDKEIYKRWSERLTFFIGTKWIKEGYGWVFPMNNDRLKVGVCKLYQSSQKHNSSNIQDLNRLIDFNKLSSLHVLEQHGGELSSTLRRSEIIYSERIIAIGDAASTANLLGGEGIRHALLSAELLASLIIDNLDSLSNCDYSNFSSFANNYQEILKSKFGWRWLISSKIAKSTWLRLSDAKADEHLNSLIDGLSENSSAEDISELLFGYKFEQQFFRLLPYLLGIK